MMTRTITCLSAIVILFIIPQSTIATTITAEDIMDDVIYADLVVEGEVVGIKDILVPRGDFFIIMPDGPKLLFKKIDFKVAKVLIGQWGNEYLSFMAAASSGGNYTYDLEVGDKYILALILHSGGKGVFQGNKYLMPHYDSARFILTDDEYAWGSKHSPSNKGNVNDLYVSIDRIREMRSVSTLTHEAEIVIRGIVTDVSIVTKDSPSGDETEYQDMSVRVTDLIKGNIQKDAIKVRMIWRGIYWPKWRVRVPEVEKDTEWYLFLKWNEEAGYYPFAGVNGMFRIEVDRIIRDNFNTDYLSMDKQGFEKKIIDEVNIRRDSK